MIRNDCIMNAVYIDYSKDTEFIKEQFKDLETTPGTCVLMDMCDSTKLKGQDYWKWILRMQNTFVIAESLPTFPGNVLKHIGDEIMIFIPDTNLSGHVHAQIFDSVKCALSKFHNEIDEVTVELKAAIHYCTNVFNITFVPQVNDYYGIDIDLSARLMSVIDKKGIAISETFYQKARLHGDELFEGISGKKEAKFKGFPTSTGYRTYQVA